MTHKILALDTAERTGWACGDISGRPAFGAFTCARSNDKDMGKDFLRFEQWLCGFLDEEKPDYVVFESPLTIGRTSKVRWLVGLAVIVEKEVRRRDILIGETDPQTIKNFMTKDPYAEKPDMVAAARIYGFPLQDEWDDEADALALWLHCFSDQAGRSPARFPAPRTQFPGPLPGVPVLQQP